MVDIQLYNVPEKGKYFFAKNPIILQFSDTGFIGSRRIVISIFGTSGKLLFSKSAPFWTGILHMQIDDILEHLVNINFEDVINGPAGILPNSAANITVKTEIEVVSGEYIPPQTQSFQLNLLSGGLPSNVFLSLSKYKSTFIDQIDLITPLWLRNPVFTFSELIVFPYLFFLNLINNTFCYISSWIGNIQKNVLIINNSKPSIVKFNINDLFQGIDTSKKCNVKILYYINNTEYDLSIDVVPENELKNPVHFIFKNMFSVFEPITLFGLKQKTRKVESETTFQYDILTNTKKEQKKIKTMMDFCECETGPLDSSQLSILEHFISSDEVYIVEEGEYQKIILDTDELITKFKQQTAESQTIKFHYTESQNRVGLLERIFDDFHADEFE